MIFVTNKRKCYGTRIFSLLETEQVPERKATRNSPCARSIRWAGSHGNAASCLPGACCLRVDLFPTATGQKAAASRAGGVEATRCSPRHSPQHTAAGPLPLPKQDSSHHSRSPSRLSSQLQWRLRQRQLLARSRSHLFREKINLLSLVNLWLDNLYYIQMKVSVL